MSTTLDYLITELRFRIGDITEPYHYLDEWLLVALKLAVKISYRYLQNKYLIDSAGNVTRNVNLPDYFNTNETTEGVIEKRDEPILIILAAIGTLNGSLENSAWNFASWRDAEISYSQQEVSRTRSDTLNRLYNDLDALIGKPTKRLATPQKYSLPGYKGNPYEREGDL
jgi:hypothetical protein